MHGNLIIVISNLARATQYYTHVFDFECTDQSPDHALIKRGKLSIKLIQEKNSTALLGMHMASPLSQNMFSPFMISIQTDNIENMYQKALSSGGRPITPITEKFNVKTARIIGIENHTWQLIQK
jgi:predicted enzyme related to lactoylglutathione lyase